MKKTTKNVTIFILILACVVSFSACGGGDTLVTVGDEKVTQEQLDGYVSYYSFLSLGTSKSELGEEELNYLQRILLDFSVEVAVLKQHYADKKVDVLPKDYDDQFTKHKASITSQGEGVQKQLSDAGVTDDVLEFFFEAQFYTQKFMEDVDKENPVTEKEIKDYYDKNKETFVSPAQIKASHILIADTSHTAIGKSSIEAIKTKIDSGDATFAEMASEHNPDSTKETGGDLGWFGQGNMVEEFDVAAFALDKDEMSDIVETQFGYHLILVTDKKEEVQKTFKQVQEEIKLKLEEERYTEAIDKLKEDFKIEFTDAGKKIVGDDESTESEE